jgi:hypothetical protein
VPEVSLLIRISIVVIVGVACIVATILFYHFNKPKKYTIFKPVTSVPTKRERIKNAFMLSLAIFESILLLSIPILTWQTVTILGVPVITYANLYSIGMFVVGLLIVRVLWRYYKSSEEERRKFF